MLALLCITTFSIPIEWYLSVDHLTITRVLLVFIFGLLLLKIIASGKIRRPVSLHWMALLFIVWNLFTLGWALEPDRVINLVLKYVLYLGLIWTMWEIIQTDREQNLIYDAYLWGCYFLAILLLIAFLSGSTFNPSAAYTRYSVEGMDPNFPAILVSAAIPIAWYLIVNDKPRLDRALFLPAALFCVVISGSRTALIVAVIGLAYCLRPVISKSRLRVRVTAIVSIVLAVVFLAYVPDVQWNRLALLLPDVAQQRDYTNPRLPIWIAGLEIALENPLFGVGTGNFHSAISESIGQRKGAHNTFLAIFSETGLIGLGLFFLIIGTLVFRLMRGASRHKTICSMLLVMWFLAANSFNYIDYTYTWLVFGLVLVSTRHFDIRPAQSLAVEMRGTQRHGIVSNSFCPEK
jgi:O-antigen ligase